MRTAALKAVCLCSQCEWMSQEPFQLGFIQPIYLPTYGVFNDDFVETHDKCKALSGNPRVSGQVLSSTQCVDSGTRLAASPHGVPLRLGTWYPAPTTGHGKRKRQNYEIEILPKRGGESDDSHHDAASLDHHKACAFFLLRW